MSELKRLVDRLIFEPGSPSRPDRLLGLGLMGLVALGAWLIVWPFIPPLVSGIVVQVFNAFAAVWSALSSLWWR